MKEIVQFRCQPRYRAGLVFPYCYLFSIGEFAKIAFSDTGAEWIGARLGSLLINMLALLNN